MPVVIVAIAIAVAAGVAVLVLFVAGRLRGAADDRRRTSEGGSPGIELRRRFLEGTPAGLGLAEPKEVWGVAMDWSVGDNVATVISLSDGSASLYTTSSFGIIGGSGHAHVRAAAERWCVVAERYVSHASPTSDLAYPSPGEVQFFLRTGGRGLVSTRVSEQAVKIPSHPLHTLFIAAHDVISQLRIASETRAG